MLINRDERARKVAEGEIANLDGRNSVLCSMIKDLVEPAMGAEMKGGGGGNFWRCFRLHGRQFPMQGDP